MFEFFEVECGELFVLLYFEEYCVVFVFVKECLCFFVELCLVDFGCGVFELDCYGFVCGILKVVV